MKHTLTCTAHNLTLTGGLKIYAVFVTFVWIMKSPVISSEELKILLEVIKYGKHVIPS
jgi:hypothetical protein